jgi:hypothetical protein
MDNYVYYVLITQRKNGDELTVNAVNSNRRLIEISRDAFLRQNPEEYLAVIQEEHAVVESLVEIETAPIPEDVVEDKQNGGIREEEKAPDEGKGFLAKIHGAFKS